MYNRHEGDDLLSEDQRLKYRWQWCRVASGIGAEELKKWTHFQMSECEIGDWTLTATSWGGENVTYEASIIYREKVVSSDGFKTRIEAQIAAEKLVRLWTAKQYNFFRCLNDKQKGSK